MKARQYDWRGGGLRKPPRLNLNLVWAGPLSFSIKEGDRPHETEAVPFHSTSTCRRGSVRAKLLTFPITQRQNGSASGSESGDLHDGGPRRCGTARGRMARA